MKSAFTSFVPASLLQVVITVVSLGLLSPAQASVSPAEPAEMAEQSLSTLLTDIVYTGKSYVVVGWRGHVLKSEQGRSWKQLEVPVNVLLTAVDFVDENYGWIVGHDGTVLHTQDGGDSWAIQSFEIGLPAFLDLAFSDRLNGLAVGTYGAMYRTRDGGKTWEAQQNALTDAGFHLNDLQRLNSGELLVVGEFGTLAMTVDQGDSWVELSSPYSSSLFAAAPYGEKGAVIGGLRGNLFVSDDVSSGQWRSVPNSVHQSIFGITDLGDGRGHAIAALNGRLLLLSAEGDLKSLELDNERAGIPPAPPAAPPYVHVLSDKVDQELGAFCRVLSLGDGLLTVGGSGVRFWDMQ